MVMRPFSPDERAWLASQRLGRLATVSPDGVVGNAPVTYFVRSDDTIDIGGMRMGATKKFSQRAGRLPGRLRRGPRRHLQRLASHLPRDPRPGRRAVRCRASADGFSTEIIRIHPDWIRSFNLPASGS